MTSLLDRPHASNSRHPRHSSPAPGPQATTTTAVVGLGYVGLPNALGLADAGHTIVAYGISESRLADTKAGRVDLLAYDQARLPQHLGLERFTLTTEAQHLTATDAVAVCVSTPVDEHFVPDLH